MSEQPKFAFGNSTAGANSAAPSGGLFGAPSPSSNLFGSKPAAPSGGLFGSGGQSSSGTSTGTPSFSFGDIGKKPEGGMAAPNSGLSFGTPAKAPTTSAAPSGGLFGGASTGVGGSGLFSNSGSNSAPASTGNATFGSTTPAPAKSGTSFSFGSTTPAGPPPINSSAAPTAGLFGSAGGSKPAAPSLFGTKASDAPAPSASPAPTSSAPTSSAPAAAGPSSGGWSFGNKAPAAPSTFGQQANQPAAPAVGSGAGLFGQAANQQASSSAAPTSLFGATPGASSAPAKFDLSKPSEQTKPGAAPGLFGAPAQAASAAPSPAATTTASAPSKPASGLFGGSAEASKTAPTFTLGQPAAPTTTAEQKPAEPSSKPAFGGFPPSSGASTGLFGGLSSKTGGADSASAKLPSAPSADATSQAPVSGLFAPAAGSTSATPAAGKPATSAAPAPTFGGASTTAGAGAPTANLGASTTGPPPPSQSRLKNKTMDEIITRWATDLTKYQKEFQAQAEQVAAWDQMLVDNMAKISKLYIATATAEKQTSSVEMQLTAVENQQEELGSWLDRYEREVDEMMGKGIGGDGALQGVDQEREQTYKLAEKLSDRLEDMGKDLTTMIEDINTASTSLSAQTKSDEPISQIVRILNSHLTQLQAIDQGTSTLQAKIAAAQKNGRELGGYGNGYSGGYGGMGNQTGAAEDFYRSYMGRR